MTDGRECYLVVMRIVRDGIRNGNRINLVTLFMQDGSFGTIYFRFYCYDLWNLMFILDISKILPGFCKYLFRFDIPCNH